MVHMNIRKRRRRSPPIPRCRSPRRASWAGHISVHQPGGDDKMLAPGGMIENAQGSIDLMSTDRPLRLGGGATNRRRHGAQAAIAADPAGGAMMLVCRCPACASAGALLWRRPPPWRSSRPRRRRHAPCRQADAATGRPPATVPAPPTPTPDAARAAPMTLLLRGLDKITGRPTDIVAPDRQAGAFRHPHHHGALLLFHPAPARRRKPRPLCRSTITAPTRARSGFFPAGCMPPAPASTAWSIRSMTCG